MTKAAVLGFLYTLAVPAAAMAESAPPAKIDAAAQTDFLGEIVITAQRRVEKLDQVPIAASVVSGAELTTRLATDAIWAGVTSWSCLNTTSSV